MEHMLWQNQCTVAVPVLSPQGCTQHCIVQKKKTGPLHKSLGKQSFTAGYFNTYGEKKGHREKSGEVDSGEEKRLLKAHHGDQG